MSQNLDQILSEAASKNLSLTDALESLADRELEARNGRSIERRLRFSRLGGRCLRIPANPTSDSDLKASTDSDAKHPGA